MTRITAQALQARLNASTTHCCDVTAAAVTEACTACLIDIGCLWLRHTLWRSLRRYTAWAGIGVALSGGSLVLLGGICPGGGASAAGSAATPPLNTRPALPVERGAIHGCLDGEHAHLSNRATGTTNPGSSQAPLHVTASMQPDCGRQRGTHLGSSIEPHTRPSARAPGPSLMACDECSRSFLSGRQIPTSAAPGCVGEPPVT